MMNGPGQADLAVTSEQGIEGPTKSATLRNREKSGIIYQDREGRRRRKFAGEENYLRF